jgi:tetratricopeptide (TPR) repeat protein
MMRVSFSTFRRALRPTGPRLLPRPAPAPRVFSTAGPSGPAPAVDMDIAAKWKELDALRESHGVDADETLSMMSNLANVLRDTGNMDGAADLYKEAEVEVRKKYGDFHPHTYSSAANLGTVYGMLGRVDQGIPLLRQAVDGFSPLGSTHRQPLVQALSYLSLLLHQTGKLEEALPCYAQAIEQRKLLAYSEERAPEEGTTTSTSTTSTTSSTSTTTTTTTIALLSCSVHVIHIHDD